MSWIGKAAVAVERSPMLLCELFEQALASLDREREIFSGFSAAKDVILKISGDDFSSFQKSDRVPLPDPAKPTPGVLKNIGDIAAYFAACLRNGQGTDIPLDEPDVALPMTRHFKHQIAVGGTGTQTANCLANCGFTHIFTHVPYLAPELESLLHPAIRLYGNNAYYDRLYPERTTYAGVHYILDYAAGAKVTTTDGILSAPRPDRLILGGHPYNRRLRIADEFIRLFDSPHPGSALIMAGFNAAREFEDFLAFVDDCSRLLDNYRRHTPDEMAFVHIEECHHENQPAERRKVLAEKIWPKIDSIGMNEAEFATLGGFLGIEDDDVWRRLLEIAVRLGCNRACLHTADRCFAVSRYAAHKEQKALGMGIILASARAHFGDFSALPAIRGMLEKALPLSEKTRLPEPKTLEDAYVGVEVPTLKGLPVVSSIGLGDAFTAGTTACL